MNEPTLGIQDISSNIGEMVMNVWTPFRNMD